MGDDGWVRVEWANGTTNSYRMGIEGKYDLTLASPPSPITSESETEEANSHGNVYKMNFIQKIKKLKFFVHSNKFVFAASQSIKDNQLIKLLHDASINFLRNIAISAGLSKSNLHANTLHGLSSLFCSTINLNFSEWSNLTLIRSICQTQQLCRAFSSKPWIKMLLDFVSFSESGEVKELNLPKQVLISLLHNNLAVCNLFFFSDLHHTSS